MKKMLGLILALMLVCFASQVNAEEKAFTLSVDVAFVTKYISGLSGSRIFNDSVIQPLITLVHNPTDLYAKGWASFSPRGGFNNDSGEEIDGYLGKRTTYGGFTFDFGIAYYNYPKFAERTGDQYGVYLNTDFPKVAGVTPYLLLEGDGPVKSSTGGYLYRLGGRYAFEVGKYPSLGIDLSIAGHDGAYGTRPELVSSTRLSLFSTVKLWKIGISPQLNFQKRLGYAASDGGMTHDEFWCGVNLSYSFSF